MLGKPGRMIGRKPRNREGKRKNLIASCEASRRKQEKKNRRLSSEMLKQKGSKENGSQALIPEEKTKREAPVEQLWERSREGRKETNRKLST